MVRLRPALRFALLSAIAFGTGMAFPRPACGQSVLENNPFSLKWYEISTPNFRVLFPRGLEEEAQRVANTLEHIRTPEAESLGGSVPRRIPVILQNQTAISNGFVSVLPRRTEFFMTPPQDYNFTGTNDWLNMLVSHEYRHIVQYQHARRGFTGLLYYVFGGATFAAMAGAAAPDWFWEGDAVATETAFTPGGRGRIPNFSLVFRTNLLEGREFNYHKQVLRSYKHNIPDEYVLGYHMVSYLRKRTGDPDIWGKITARSWKIPFIPFAFSNAIKKETGVYVTGLYREMADDLQATWRERMDGMTLTPFETITPRKSKAYTDYLYPQALSDGSVLAMKTGIGDIQRFVVLRDGEEHHVFTPGFVNDSGMLSAAGGKVAWNEYGFDGRWRMRTYSQVKVFDRSTRLAPRIIGPPHARFGSAALSPDGTRIATVQTTEDYKNQLVVLDYESGQSVRVFSNPDNEFYSMPRWSTDGSKIAVLKTSDKGRTISLMDVATGLGKDVLPRSNENVGHPLLAGDYLLFNSPAGGIDNIHALKVSTGERFVVTTSRYGAYNPSLSPDGATLYYNDQTKNGLDVVRTEFDPSRWRPYPGDTVTHAAYAHLVEQEANPNLLKTVPDKEYPVKKYPKLKGVFNPYIWGLNVDSDLTEATVGISSRDLLSTTEIRAGYTVDINERTGAWTAELSYQGLYPIIDVSGSLANRSVNEGNLSYYKKVGSDTVLTMDNLHFDWQERIIRAGLRLPLLAINGRYSGRITLSDHFSLTQISSFRNSIDGEGRIITTDFGGYIFRNYLDEGTFLHNQFAIEISRLLKQSRRDINSKWGQVLNLNVLSTPPGSDYYARQFSFYGIGYFPGLFKHHSLWGYWAYQKTKIDAPSGEGLKNYIFRNMIPLPRGHSHRRFQNFYSMSGNYTMPIWYPDIALGPIVNFQRLRGNVFFDYGFGSTNLPPEPIAMTYMSTGVEFKLDLNIMRFYPQFDIGVRFTRGLTPVTSEFEVLIGTFNL